jgi:hypothetical protein
VTLENQVLVFQLKNVKKLNFKKVTKDGVKNSEKKNKPDN